jgi:FMN-dependent NADH-azoreductase
VPTLLHLDSSANRSRESVTRQLTALFAETWRTQHGSAGYRYRDLVANPVPHIDTAYCALGRRVERHDVSSQAEVATLIESPAEQREWARTQPLVAELLATDTVVIGAPMYNLSISASLKAWIDRVNFPAMFKEPGTRRSLLHDTTIVVISARGGAYGAGTPNEACDFQTPYLRAYFGKQGVAAENLFFVCAEMAVADLIPRLAPFRSLAKSSLAAARSEVTSLAQCRLRDCGQIA